MKLSHWPSDLLRRVSPRERRFILAGAGVAAALVVLTAALPLVRRWTAREAVYVTTRDQWARMAGLAAGIDQLRNTRDTQRQAQGTELARLVTGATPALAASGLQSLLQRFAEEHGVQLDRVDVATQPRPDRGGLLAIPAQLQGQSDITGLVDFLLRIQVSQVLLVIDELAVNAGTDGQDGRQTLIWTVRLHGLYRAEVPPPTRGAPTS
jgi:type II secretion system (T2SS) protein M